MLNKLLKLANRLDQLGFYQAADRIDELLKQASMTPQEYEKFYGAPMNFQQLKEWMSLKHKSRPTTNETCPECGKKLVFMYPGNNPENGPADFRCKEDHFDFEVDVDA